MKSGSKFSSEFIASEDNKTPSTSIQFQVFHNTVRNSSVKSESIPPFIVTAFHNAESSHTCIGETLQRIEESVNFSKMRRRCKKLKDQDDSVGCNIGRWEKDERARFIEALEKYDKDWKKIQDYVGTRSIVQIRSHAQKYFSKLERDIAKKERSKLEAQIVAAPKYRSVSEPIMLPIKKIKLKQYSPGVTQIEFKPKKRTQPLKEELFSDIDKQVLKKTTTECNTVELDNKSPDIDWELASEQSPLNNLYNQLEPIEVSSEERIGVCKEMFFDNINFA